MQDIKGSKLRDSESIANTKICFEVRAPSSTSPPLHRRIFTMSSTQDFTHREPPLRIWVIQFWSTQLLSQPTTTSTLEVRHNNNHLYTQRDGHLAKQQSPHTRGIIHKANTPTITSTLRGIPTKPNSTSTINNQHYTRGITTNPNKRRFTTLGGFSKPQINFLTKTRS